jgi:hypothetical protein
LKYASVSNMSLKKDSGEHRTFKRDGGKVWGEIQSLRLKLRKRVAA